jgi:hypothetical protein
MRHALLISEFLTTPWALMPERITAFAGIVARWAAERAPSAEVRERIAGDKEVREARRGESRVAGGGAIMVLPMYGVVAQRGNMADDISGPGAMSTQKFSQAFRQALADPTVAPSSSISIRPEDPSMEFKSSPKRSCRPWAEARRRHRQQLAASAAYWIGRRLPSSTSRPAAK